MKTILTLILIILSCLAAIAQETRIYDNRMNLRYRVEGNKIYDNRNRQIGVREKGRIYDNKMNLKYQLEGDEKSDLKKK